MAGSGGRGEERKVERRWGGDDDDDAKKSESSIFLFFFESLFHFFFFPFALSLEHFCPSLGRARGLFFFLLLLLVSLALSRLVQTQHVVIMPPAPPNAPEPGLYDALSARLRAEGRAFTDAVFGTRTTTVGASLQRPRKAALRIEPKTYFGEGVVEMNWGGGACFIPSRLDCSPPRRKKNRFPRPRFASFFLVLILFLWSATHAVTFFFRRGGKKNNRIDCTR